MNFRRTEIVFPDSNQQEQGLTKNRTIDECKHIWQMYAHVILAFESGCCCCCCCWWWWWWWWCLLLLNQIRPQILVKKLFHLSCSCPLKKSTKNNDNDMFACSLVNLLTYTGRCPCSTEQEPPASPGRVNLLPLRLSRQQGQIQEKKIQHLKVGNQSARLPRNVKSHVCPAL